MGKPDTLGESKFKVGDHVHKPRGYKFPSIIVAVFPIEEGEWRYVARLKDYGLMHIFNGEQLDLDKP